MIAIIVIISILFIDKIFFADSIKITYIGELNGGSANCYWFSITKEAALEEEYIKSDSEIYERIKQIDGSKYKLVLSGGLPLKKLSIEPGTHIGMAKYDDCKAQAEKIYIYIIDRDIQIRPLDA